MMIFRKNKKGQLNKPSNVRFFFANNFSKKVPPSHFFDVKMGSLLAKTQKTSVH